MSAAQKHNERVSQSNPRVLLIEDEPDVAANLFEFLDAHGFIMDLATDGVTGLHLAVVNNYDVIVLDVTLPGMDGLTLCRRLRNDAQKTTPVIMLTARDALADKLAGFSAGTDDYLVKPFDLPELQARLDALMSRDVPNRQSILTVAELSFDTATLDIKRGARSIELNHSCRKILEVLMRESPRVVPRQRLERELWGDDPPDSDSLRSHICTLRAVVDRPYSHHMIVTVHRTGYRLVASDAVD